MIYEKHSVRLRYALMKGSCPPEDAEDLLQDLMMILLEKGVKWSGKKPFAAYLFGIAKFLQRRLFWKRQRFSRIHEPLGKDGDERRWELVEAPPSAWESEKTRREYVETWETFLEKLMGLSQSEMERGRCSALMAALSITENQSPFLQILERAESEGGKLDWPTINSTRQNKTLLMRLLARIPDRQFSSEYPGPPADDLNETFGNSPEVIVCSHARMRAKVWSYWARMQK